jgi:putative transposase
MAWRQVKVEEQRMKLALAVEAGISITDACLQFGISRPTGYKWLKRHEEEGKEGLYDRSRAPHSNPNAIEDHIEKGILEMRLKFPKLGPKKVHAKLLELHPNTEWPCSSSVGNVLDRNGLVVKRKCRKRVAANTPSIFNGEQPNEVWCMDFKGTIRTVDNTGYEPFTLTDSSSRFLIKCQLLIRNNFKYVWGSLETAFREYGLPEYILSDNGPPFATIGVGRLSRLSVHLIKSGVQPLWIPPGQPQKNGRHERMHGTMERELGRPSANSEMDLKVKLRRFQEYYNYDRPHESLGQKAPGKVYISSERQWNGVLRSPEYSDEHVIRKVQKDGTINLKNRRIFVGEALEKEPVGLIDTLEGLGVYYGPIYLGVINENKLEFPREKKRRA